MKQNSNIKNNNQSQKQSTSSFSSKSSSCENTATKSNQIYTNN
jgi:hypothetical protein